MSTDVRIGIIGGGLMGREAAVAFARWSALIDHPASPRLVAVCDTAPDALSWFAAFPSVELLTDDHRALLDHDVDVVYVAVPHHLHETIYIDVLEAGCDLLAEKPFGIDLDAALAIEAAATRTGRFVRCSSEMPFFSGAQLAFETVRSGAIGQVIEATSSFLHSSDINRSKPINWKRQIDTCGRIGVMGDLGLHVAHLPLRLGWQPERVYAAIQNIVPQRYDGDGNLVPCDTSDNATLTCEVPHDGSWFPLRLETKRIAPGQSNTWAFEVLGMDGGVRFSTRSPQVVERFRHHEGGQIWEQVQPGHSSVWPTITGSIFEFGFTDALLQMWAAYLAERTGSFGGRFGCATVAEAVNSHRIFAAALSSSQDHLVASVEY